MVCWGIQCVVVGLSLCPVVGGLECVVMVVLDEGFINKGLMGGQ